MQSDDKNVVAANTDERSTAQQRRGKGGRGGLGNPGKSDRDEERNEPPDPSLAHRGGRPSFLNGDGTLNKRI